MPTAKPDVPPQPPKRRVLVVDDHTVVREGLTQCINHQPDLAVCGEAQSAAEALQAIHRFKPDIVVLDLALTNSHGLELIKDLRAQHNPVPILVYTMFDESLYALRALQAGARGYLTKVEPSERLLTAIRTILKGDYALSPQISNRFLQSFLRPSAKRVSALERQAGSRDFVEHLGDRELQVFGLIGKGLGTREIAAELGCNIKTIETYRARIKQKLQLASGTALVREAVRWVEAHH